MHAPARRRGFTLIEVLVVLIVLGILVGLLVPAVTGAYNKARVTAAAAEVRNMSLALEAFKQQYGAYPPSRLLVAEDGDYSAAAVGPVNAPLAPRSLRALRGLWPRLDLRTDGSKPPVPGGWFDVNGDHVKQTKPYVLSGSECLVLFLGGVQAKTDQGWTVDGFDKNPKNPFTSPVTPDKDSPVTWPASTNRQAPFYAFTGGGRLAPAGNPDLAPAAQTVAYVDPLSRTRFYAYFSAYGGLGYDPDDVNADEFSEDETISGVLGALQTRGAATPTAPLAPNRRDVVISPAPNPYTEDTPLPVAADGALNAADGRDRVYHAKTKFQILCAGLDGKFGIGGQWDSREASAVKLPEYLAATAALTKQTLGPACRAVERDNVASFSAGALDR